MSTDADPPKAGDFEYDGNDQAQFDYQQGRINDHLEKYPGCGEALTMLKNLIARGEPWPKPQFETMIQALPKVLIVSYMIRIRIESAIGRPVVLGYVVVGFSDSEMRELIERFPSDAIRGQDPRLNSTLRERITEAESAKAKIRNVLNLPKSTQISFHPQDPSPTRDEVQRWPSFEDGGRMFWVNRRTSD
jgi:hypothetical protein